MPTAFTTTKYVALVHGGIDTTITGGITITKTINVNLTYVKVSNSALNASSYNLLGYITTLDESSIDTALVAYQSSTMNAQRSKSASEALQSEALLHTS